jgi:hypothetical protein
MGQCAVKDALSKRSVDVVDHVWTWSGVAGMDDLGAATVVARSMALRDASRRPQRYLTST